MIEEPQTWLLFQIDGSTVTLLFQHKNRSICPTNIMVTYYYSPEHDKKKIIIIKKDIILTCTLASKGLMMVMMIRLTLTCS